MSESISHLIDILISLSEDDNLEVAKKSKKALNKIFDKSHITLNITTEVVQENLYNVLTKFPRVMNEAGIVAILSFYVNFIWNVVLDLTKKVNILNLLIGYLRIIKNNLENILQSSSHLQRLILSLVHVSQLERTNISLFEEHAIRGYVLYRVLQLIWVWRKIYFVNRKLVLESFYGPVILNKYMLATQGVSVCFTQ